VVRQGKAYAKINPIMHQTKTMLTIVALLLALLAYIPYYRDIFRGKTKPHSFTWLVWCVMATVAFFSQVSDGAGVGAWVLALAAVSNFAIFSLSLYKGETSINRMDWFCLMGAFLGVALFTFNQDPPMSLIIICAVDIIGFIPTVRKSLLRPHQETASTFGITSLKYFFSIAALENYTFITVIYPLVAGSMNLFFVILLITQRKKIKALLSKKRTSAKTTKAAVTTRIKNKPAKKR
jgi:hypothetical protein